MDNTPFTTVALAAGESKRFKEYGISKPKGMIDLRWRGNTSSMLEHSAQLYGVRFAKWPVRIAVRHADSKQWMEWSAIGVRPRYGFHYIVASSGQADTAQQAVEMIDGHILIVNCDNAFELNLERFVERCRRQQVACGAIVFPSNGEAKYGYVNDAPWFDYGAEKSPISQWALAGAFYFKDRHVLRTAYTAVPWVTGRERYLSQVFGHITGPLLAYRIGRNDLHEWGTPQDVLDDHTIGIADEEWPRTEAP